MIYKRFILVLLAMVITSTIWSQQSQTNRYLETNNPRIERQPLGFSLSSTVGFITIPQPNLGNNLWCSANLGYSKKNWNFTVWTGANYWIEGKQPDLRLGLSASYNWIKW